MNLDISYEPESEEVRCTLDDAITLSVTKMGTNLYRYLGFNKIDDEPTRDAIKEIAHTLLDLTQPE